MSIRAAEGGVEIGLRVQPRASRTEVVGLLGGAIKIRLAAPPVDGAANAELIAFLAKRLGVRKGDVTLVAGRASRAKRVRVMGIGVGEVHPKLGLGEPGADQGG